MDATRMNKDLPPASPSAGAPRSRVFTIFAIVFTNVLGAGVVIPTLPLYAKDAFNANAIDAGYFTALYYVAQMAAAPWLGRLSDRVGRRPVLIISQIGTVLSFCLFIFANPLGHLLERAGLTFGFATGLLMLYIARLLDGVTGGNITTAQAYLTDITHDETERTQALAYIRLAFGLGLVFGPAFGAVLLNINLLAPFVGAALITSITVILTILILHESLPVEARRRAQEQPLRMGFGWQTITSNPNIGVILILAFIVSVNLAAISAIFPLYADEVIYRGELTEALVARNVGYMLTALGLTVAATQLLFLRPLLKRFERQDLIIASMVCAMISVTGLTFASQPRLITLIIMPAAAAYAIGVPCGEALLVRVGRGTKSGQLLGLFQSVNSSAYIFGPIVGGYLYEIHPRGPFVAGMAISLCSIGLAIVLKQRLLLETRFAEL